MSVTSPVAPAAFVENVPSLLRLAEAAAARREHDGARLQLERPAGVVLALERRADAVLVAARARRAARDRAS